jgi:hypothetical protein
MSAIDPSAGLPRGQVIGTYDAYADAQRAVDFLSDEKFPVEHVSIVGSDLKMVENVTGRLTRARAAIAGAGTGLWLGLFVGLLLTLFARPDDDSSPNTALLILSSAVYGAIFGAIFGFIGHALTGGRRDFSSRSRIVSSRYEIICKWNEADRAREVLTRLPAGG